MIADTITISGVITDTISRLDLGYPEGYFNDRLVEVNPMFEEIAIKLFGRDFDHDAALSWSARLLGWKDKGRSIPEKQAAAAVGQIGLVETYRKRFARYDRAVGQVLLTRHGLENRERFLNARHTLMTLLDLGVVPIVNENDTVATEEIRFGDNDNLSATVVNLVGADLLVILTDVDGLYPEPPGANGPRAQDLDVLCAELLRFDPAAGGPGRSVSD